MKHPGQLLQDKLNESGMTRKELAVRTGVTEKHICTIVNGAKPISFDFARKLGYVFANARYWIDLQTKYDEEQLRIQEQNNIGDDEKNLLKPLHDITEYLIESGYIHNDCGDTEKVLQLRGFLNISNLLLIPKIPYNAAYRAQLTNNVKVDPYVLFTWQRLCEIETAKLDVKKIVDKELLRESIESIKKQMFGDINRGIQGIQDILGECGIAFQVVKNFRGAPVQGFIKETTEGRLLLCLTIRGKRADSFWFTLFHEIAHILNGDYKSKFVDFDSVHGKGEELADKFACDVLIPPQKYQRFVMSRNCTSWTNIEAFANEVEIEPFIVLGRMQNDGYLDWSDYPEKVVRYNWA